MLPADFDLYLRRRHPTRRANRYRERVEHFLAVNSGLYELHRMHDYIRKAPTVALRTTAQEALGELHLFLHNQPMPPLAEDTVDRKDYYQAERMNFYRWLLRNKGLAVSTAGQYVSRAFRLLERLDEEPDRTPEELTAGMKSMGLTTIAWGYLQAWVKEAPEDAPAVDPEVVSGSRQVANEGLTLPGHVVRALRRLEALGWSVRRLATLRWCDLRSYRNAAGQVIAVDAPLDSDRPHVRLAAVKGKNLEALDTLWDWAAPDLPDHPLVPVVHRAQVPARVTLIRRSLQEDQAADQGNLDLAQGR